MPGAREHLHWFALKSVPLIGNVTFLRLLSHFGSPERALGAGPEELAQVKGLSRAAAASLLTHDGYPFAEAECLKLERTGVQVVDLLSPCYPKLLLEIADPPPYLYLRGELQGNEPALAVVGSRHASVYGLSTTTKLVRDLVHRGITVVSGMARGIDTAAHWGAVRSGGRSIGVLGCGLDVTYPPENGPLMEAVAQQGALISEFPLGTTPAPENFPRRNRIISALAQGVLVVEAGEKSGSLITARFALEQGREVFAVPGNVNSLSSSGVNRLIKDGAKLVDRVEDILDELPQLRLPVREGGEAPQFGLTPQEAEIYALLGPAPLQMDEIIARSALTAGEVSAILLRLELKGAVVQLPGKHFTLN